MLTQMQQKANLNQRLNWLNQVKFKLQNQTNYLITLSYKSWTIKLFEGLNPERALQFTTIILDQILAESKTWI